MYVAPLGLQEQWPYVIGSDTNEAPTGSRLEFEEDGRLLGPPHTLHGSIIADGAGRYSHYQDAVLFAASDNSDPRTNGRRYTFRTAQVLEPSIRDPLLAILLVIDVALAFCFRRALRHTIPQIAARLPVVIGVAGCLILVVVVAAASGLFGHVVLNYVGAPKDAAFAWSIVRHVALGCATAIGLWSAAAGLLRLFPAFRNADVPGLMLPAFPLSLVVTAALSGIALMLPAGRAIAFILWLACLAPLAGWRPPARQWRALLKAALAIVPLAMAFGAWLGLLWHGPTDTLSGAPSGDLNYYAGNIWALAVNPLSFVNLGYENGFPLSHFNELYPALGSVLLPLPGFDPFLFLLCGTGTSYVLWGGLALHMLLSDRGTRMLGALDVAILVTAFVAAMRYPYWVAESVPTPFMPALTISVWWMSRRGAQTTAWSIAATLAALAGTALSKVTSAVTLVPLAAQHGVDRLLHGTFAVRAAIATVGLAVAAYAAWVLQQWLPLYLAISRVGPESYRVPLWYFYLRDVSAVVLIALAWRMVAAPVALSLTLGLAAFLAFSWVLQINYVVAVLTFGLIAATVPLRSTVLKSCLLAALALALPALYYGEPSGPFTSVVWIFCVGGATLIAVMTSPAVANVAFKTRHAAALAMFALAMIATALVGAARGTLVIDSGWALWQRDRLTPEFKQAWSAVRELTPPDALIFTDETDDTANLLGGWNAYAVSGQRSIFIASYINAFELVESAALRDKVFADNDAVLSGARSPRDVPAQFHHGSYFAVVNATRNVPPSWRKVFSNRSFALYEIPA